MRHIGFTIATATLLFGLATHARATAAEPLAGNAAARQVSVLLDGREIYSQSVSPGVIHLVTPPQKAAGGTSVVSLQVDHTFSVPGDSRQLGISLFAGGWGR